MDLSWKVHTVKDRGIGNWYRYSITGIIVDAGREPQNFSWQVQNFNDPRYDLSAVDPKSLSW